MTQHIPAHFADRFGRKITYVRISVTERCNFRCVYCMPAEGIGHVSSREYLSFDEIREVAEVFGAEGVRRVRITGGEPLVRPGIPNLVETLKAVDGIERVALTTNGFLLKKYAQDLKNAGLDSLNISLDTLDRDRFKEITRVGDLDRVLEGIDAARDAGFERIKLNAVIVAGFNDDELVDLVRFAIDRGVIMRFIEFMPIGDTIWVQALQKSAHASQNSAGRDLSDSNAHKTAHTTAHKIDEVSAIPTRTRGSCVPARDMRQALGEHYRLEPDSRRYGTGPARYWRLHDEHSPPEGHPFGIIAAVTECFCDQCNRVRLTARGGLRACLADDAEVDLRAPLRTFADAGERRAEIQSRIRQALYGKKERHAFDIEGGSVTRKNMTAIGG